ncbi:glycosyltransferase [Winogradskyella sp. SM1960]|uniref:glycosyltransferase n=1 Tax=Winogradskyella sp. SM1960 TaxID=2865955 RepID=UPI001CD4713A|nr:glycosyltransferase [Winogradskyella sp. SM1960]
MRVFIVSPTESVITQRGKRHPNLANYLIEKGYEVHYITSTINHASKELFTATDLKNGQEQVSYPIHFIDVGLYKTNISPKRFFWNIKFAYKVYKYLKKIVRKEDIVLFPSRPPELPFVGKLLKKKYSIKLVLDIEDIWPDAFLINNRIIKSTFYSYCNALNSRSVPAFDSVVHVSPSFTKWFQRYAPERTSIFTPLGITCLEDNTEGKKFYASEPKQFKLFYGGTLTLQFDIMPVLKAMQKSKLNFSITLAGDNGSGERAKMVKEFIELNNIDHRNLGLLNKKDFIKQLGNSDIAILPMISGGLPKKFFDALGSYKPILCLGEGGAYQEVKKYDLGWTTSFKDEDVLNVLNMINIDVLNYKINNIANHRHKYLEQHSLKIIRDEILKLYKCNNSHKS